MKIAQIITIPKIITGRDELVVLPRKVFERLMKKQVKESDVLQWSAEAKKLKKEGKLSVLHSLKDLR